MLWFADHTQQRTATRGGRNGYCAGPYVFTEHSEAAAVAAGRIIHSPFSIVAARPPEPGATRILRWDWLQPHLTCPSPPQPGGRRALLAKPHRLMRIGAIQAIGTARAAGQRQMNLAIGQRSVRSDQVPTTTSERMCLSTACA